MTHTSHLQELMSMGYPESKASMALQVACGDMEQAVGYLLLGEQSQAQFAPLSTVPCTPPTSNVDELVFMGYSRQAATDALRVAGGDMDQAVNYLLMGESRSGFIIPPNEGVDDAAVAASLQRQEFRHDQSSAVARAHPQLATATGPSHQPTPGVEPPRMVASSTTLTTPGAEPYCACVAASTFLSGGVVTAQFINDILSGGIELFRKGSGAQTTLAKVLHKHGRSPLGLAVHSGDPRMGTFMTDDIHHSLGIRRQLSICRNEQGEGWQLLVLEIPNFESFCIALPPKGTKNKFWYFDFYPRSCFKVPGAYARVHNSLLQLQESLELVFATMLKHTGKGYEHFQLYRVKKIR